MREITLNIGPDHKVSKSVLATKLSQLKARGLMDAGLVLVNERGMLHGYLAEGELDFAIHEDGVLKDGKPVDLLEGPLAAFVDRTPLTICEKAPMEYAVSIWPLTYISIWTNSVFPNFSFSLNGKLTPKFFQVQMFVGLGLRHLIVVEEGTCKVVGVVIKKRLVLYLEGLKH